MLRYYTQNWKKAGTILFGQMAWIKETTSLQGSQWTKLQLQQQTVINIKWLMLLPGNWPKIGSI